MKEVTRFANPLTLLEQVTQDLAKLGPKKFMSGAGHLPQKAKELFFAFFFVMGLKKLTGIDWWLSQDVGDTFPDFDLIGFYDVDPFAAIYRFELVTIPDHCKNFNEAFDIVKGKFKKGYPTKFNLLIFINNSNSRVWMNQLNEAIENYDPFKEVWVVFPLYKNANEVAATVVNRLRPRPSKGTAVKFDDPDLKKPQKLPDFLEEIEVDGLKNLRVNEEFLTEFRKKMIKNRLKRK